MKATTKKAVKKPATPKKPAFYWGVEYCEEVTGRWHLSVERTREGQRIWAQALKGCGCSHVRKVKIPTKKLETCK